MFQSVYNYDLACFDVINRSLQNVVFDIVMPILSEFSYFIIPLLFLLTLFVRYYKKKGGILLLLTVVTVISSDQISSAVLKPLIGRYRPCNERGDIHLFVHHQWMQTPAFPLKFYKPKRSYSFPSSHAANTFAVATLWYTYLKGPYWLLFFLAAAISYSRIYLGVHYPLDVIGGALLGILTALFWFYCYQDILLRFAWFKPNRPQEQPVENQSQGDV
ncbi:phosphatase PAP2 family protein [candidate division CSSED10-310 bacterium]|uniref:Phosphatase PAP2 family protein n=1 Tax=candidate division CSSED10-310 bacterium TaxID=2855610 RepID=A0ABV6YZU3_UNCC1